MRLALLLAFAALAARAEDTPKPDTGKDRAAVVPAENAPKTEGEREGAATILHRDEVLKDRGGERHLWPLLATPEARVNYFEVTGRGPLHFHPDADHRLYVLEGTVLVTCGTATTTCTAGDFIVIPRGVRHCYDVTKPGDRALLLTFDAPPYDPKKTVNLEKAK